MISLVLVFLIFGATPFATWLETYDKGNTDRGHNISLDSANRVLVIGESNPELNYDIWLIVMDKTGDSLWSILHDEGKDEKGYAVGCTHDGSITFAGSMGENSGMKTFLYTSDGEHIWDQFGAGTSNETMEVRAISISPDSIIYCLGYHLGGAIDYLVIHGYDYDGQPTMNVDIQANPAKATDVVASPSGYIYTGLDEVANCAIRKFSSEGNHEWRSLYENNVTKAHGLEMDDVGFLFQAGDVATTGSNHDFLLLKWDTTGALIWPQHKAYDMGHNEYCRDIKLDDISDCYLAGWQERGLEKDAALVKTDSAGSMLWSWVDTLEGDQEIEALEVDSDGYIYLAGSSHNGANWDMLVMQVRQPLEVKGFLDDGLDQSELTDVSVLITGDTTLEIVSDDSAFYSVELYNGGSYTFTPQLGGWVFDPPSVTYSPLAHREMDGYFFGQWTGVGENRVVSHPSWELVTFIGPQIVLQYKGYHFGLKASIYNASGRKIDEIHALSPSGTVTWGEGHAPGVYFVRDESARSPQVERAVLIR